MKESAKQFKARMVRETIENLLIVEQYITLDKTLKCNHAILGSKSKFVVVPRRVAKELISLEG